MVAMPEILQRCDPRIIPLPPSFELTPVTL